VTVDVLGPLGIEIRIRSDEVHLFAPSTGKRLN